MMATPESPREQSSGQKTDSGIRQYFLTVFISYEVYALIFNYNL